ncbi:hypothetical protein RBE51_20450 [Pseudomonas taiwanensis]|uniref:hypothetical protein n=1 Tax=Pseudomonas taiwanensis TaxID=470150 RepID=UPI0028DF064C|nr:hypothetical protein [Pseudomonas taiwanensis]MDT8925166.1 hypothetical protein [Pseudomonas taiwanensis]
MNASILDQQGQAQPTFLPFWEYFDLGVDDGRYDGVFDAEDDMPTRYEAAQRHTLAAIRRYAAGNFSRTQIEDEVRKSLEGSKFDSNMAKHRLEYNLALALSTPCHDLNALVAYASTISNRNHVIPLVFRTINKHTQVPYPELFCCLDPALWGLFRQMTDYTALDFFKASFDRDDVSMVKRLVEAEGLDKFQLDKLFSEMPYVADSQLRNWHNKPKAITAHEFYLRFEAQMLHFVDTGMTGDNGLQEWENAHDERLDELPGYEAFVEALAPDMARKLFTALKTIDAALPANMHRVHDRLMDEVSKHVDLRDYALRWFGRSPGWILTAKQRPDYDTFFLTTLLSSNSVLYDSSAYHAGARKAVQTMLRHIGHGKVAKLLRNEPDLLMTAYKITGHRPLIEMMKESDQATALGIDLGL